MDRFPKVTVQGPPVTDLYYMMYSSESDDDDDEVTNMECAVNLKLRETLTVAPGVCKPWGMAVSGPYCWTDIDIEEWIEVSSPEQINRIFQMLITRSSGSLRNDAMFSFLAQQ
ncbi:unnamed protein product [Linum trigynum]|uniref:Uncharacterized protein n=1 Tax=Linum trigynum TaxID=586398 RepID=A0AAV2C9H1_9ROSI